MIEKRFTQKDEDDWEIFENGKHFAYAHSGYNAQKIIERLNELSDKLDCHILLTDQERQKVSNFIKGIEKENDELKQENKQLQFRIIDMLDFIIKENDGVTRQEMKDWWNNKLEFYYKFIK